MSQQPAVTQRRNGICPHKDTAVQIRITLLDLFGITGFRYSFQFCLADSHSNPAVCLPDRLQRRCITQVEIQAVGLYLYLTVLQFRLCEGTGAVCADLRHNLCAVAGECQLLRRKRRAVCRHFQRGIYVVQCHCVFTQIDGQQTECIFLFCADHSMTELFRKGIAAPAPQKAESADHDSRRRCTADAAFDSTFPVGVECPDHQENQCQSKTDENCVHNVRQQQCCRQQNRCDQLCNQTLGRTLSCDQRCHKRQKHCAVHSKVVRIAERHHYAVTVANGPRQSAQLLHQEIVVIAHSVVFQQRQHTQDDCQNCETGLCEVQHLFAVDPIPRRRKYDCIPHKRQIALIEHINAHPCLSGIVRCHRGQQSQEQIDPQKEKYNCHDAGQRQFSFGTECDLLIAEPDHCRRRNGQEKPFPAQLLKIGICGIS